MAMIDYGAIIKVNGKFINKNKGLFMEFSNSGYVCKEALDLDGKLRNIDGNYFVYAGDEEMLVVFYKGIYKIISFNKVIYEEYNMPFVSCEHYLPNGIHIKISHLDKELYPDKYTIGTWKDFVKENWIGATGEEPISELQDGVKTYRRFLKNCKRYARSYSKYRTQRWIAEWEYKEDKYEVIFGYGIESNEETYNRIKYNNYGFTDKERKVLDSWFEV